MITEQFKDPILLAEQFIDLADCSWKEKNVTIPALNQFIKNNLPLIISQLNNTATAPLLRASMLSLSHRITFVWDTPEAKALAFKIMGYASGVFSQDRKKGLVPREILVKEILPHLTPRIFSEDPLRHFERGHETKSGLESALLVSKVWSEAAIQVHKDWVSRELVPFSVYNCNAADDVILKVKKENLRIANFTEYYEVRERHLQELVECPSLSTLVLNPGYCIKMIPKTLLKNLTHLILIRCYDINIEILAETLSENTKLTHFIYDAEFIPVFPLESLVQHENLECLELRGVEISSEDLASISLFKKLTNLRIKNFPEDEKSLISITNLKNLEQLVVDFLHHTRKYFQEKFIEYLPQLPKLRDLSLNPTSAKLIDILPSLDLERLEIIETKNLTKLSENLPKLKNLKILSFINCGDLTDEQIKIILPQLKELSRLKIIYSHKLTITQINKIIPQLKNLTYFYFATTWIGEKIYDELKDLQKNFPLITIEFYCPWKGY